MGRFVGIGVDHYEQSAYAPLDFAVSDVASLYQLLQRWFDGEPLADPDENTVRALFPKLKESLGEPGPLVLIWSGHGVASPNGLRLVARDGEPPEPYSSMGVADLISACARSDANQLLLIIDACYSGEAVEASSLAAAILEQNPPDSKRIWVGVLTSCLKLETAANGLLGERLGTCWRTGRRIPICGSAGRDTTNRSAAMTCATRC